jgi:malto-oligosyltrehalose trehalohydrolase
MGPSLNNAIYSSVSMDFGPCLMPGDGVLFRLWAPQASQVDLCLTVAPDQTLKVAPMAREENGWFSHRQPAAKAGDLYQFLINGKLMVPDPASRWQAQGIHGPSVVCDPAAYHWDDSAWRGRPWEETVVYELHVGTFSPQGNFKGVTERLDYLVDLGITAIELMPVSQFPGQFNWGYDGALIFAPCNSYGRPETLKELVNAAHGKGLMVFLDVVYNHFGPEGNYLYAYARKAFFTDQFQTPWGAAINFSGLQSRTVRDFYIANALYWLNEYHLDGLRFDAVHAIFDRSQPDILEEISRCVRAGPGRLRHIHLVLENDNNCSHYLSRELDGQPRYFTAQWNDDLHHACHTLLTGETEGYYLDYSDNPIRHLGRCLAEGFAYQGEKSPYRQGKTRGEPSAHLPPLAFLSFMQNHDQIGNRAMGERLTALCAEGDLKILTALVLLAPSPPLLFMGEEFGARTPFYFFSNLSAELAGSVREGRQKEFAHFAQFHSPESRAHIPDPNAEETFLHSKLDWQVISQNREKSFLVFYQKLLKIRQLEIVPCLPQIKGGGAGFRVLAEKSLTIWWPLANNRFLSTIFNLHDHSISLENSRADNTLYQYAAGTSPSWNRGKMPPKSIVWFLEKGERSHA